MKQVLILLIVLIIGATAINYEPIWISPKNTTQVDRNDVLENFVAERGVWADVPGGIGTRAGPSMHFDSKGILWIVGGSVGDFLNLNAGWNYDPDSDRYRWVAGQAQSTSRYQHLGTKGVEGPDVFPGYVSDTSTSVIDSKDQIWIYAENSLFRWNTSSGYFTFLGGDPYTIFASPVPGPLGEPSADVWPGGLDGACMVMDSLDNIWLISGFANGLVDNVASNAVWHYNTTSGYWTLVYGNSTLFTDNNFAENIFGGRTQLACEIDDNDQIWVYGGLQFDDFVNFYALGDLWKFNTSTWTWSAIFTDEDRNKPPSIDVRNEFSPNNWPGSRYGHRMINRLDGSLMLYGGYQGTTNYFYFDDIWIFNLTTYQWKIIYGAENINVSTQAQYNNYRQPGSVLGYRASYGVARGKTNKGQFVLYGGFNDVGRKKDMWIIPRDLCSLGLITCLPQATCAFVDDWQNVCQCPEGLVGDGKTSCTVPPPIAEPTTIAPTTGIPISMNSPKSTTSNAATAFYSGLLAALVALL